MYSATGQYDRETPTTKVGKLSPATPFRRTKLRKSVFNGYLILCIVLGYNTQ